MSTSGATACHSPRPLLTGTFINVGTVLLGTLIGVAVGSRLPERMQQRVMAGLGLLTGVLGISLALPPHNLNFLYVMGGVLIGGLVGEAIGIERWLERLGDRIQATVSRTGDSTVSQAFVTASLLFCVGPLTIVGSIQNGLTGDYQALATKALLDGFAAVALAAGLGWGVGLAAITILVIQGGLSLGAGAFDAVLRGQALAALISAGGVLILLLFGFAFSWIAALIGLSAPNAEVAQSAGFIWLFPLTFASSAFVPVDSMPDWLQAFADVNPVTLTVNAVRELWLGVPAGNAILWSIVWSLGLVAIFAPLSTLRYRRTSRA